MLKQALSRSYKFLFVVNLQFLDHLRLVFEQGEEFLLCLVDHFVSDFRRLLRQFMLDLKV